MIREVHQSSPNYYVCMKWADGGKYSWDGIDLCCRTQEIEAESNNTDAVYFQGSKVIFIVFLNAVSHKMRAIIERRGIICCTFCHIAVVGLDIG